MPINEVADSNVHRVQDFMDAKCTPLKILGCHGTHASEPSVDGTSQLAIKAGFYVAYQHSLEKDNDVGIEKFFHPCIW